MSRAGMLRERVEIQKETEGASDGAGGYEEAWLLHAKVFGRLMTKRGRETVQAAAVEEVAPAIIEIRYLSTVTHNMRAVIDSTAYNIRSVTHDHRKTRSFLHCDAGVAQ